MNRPPEFRVPAVTHDFPVPSISQGSGSGTLLRFLFLVGSGLILALGLACGGGGGAEPPPPQPLPYIQSFSASPNPVTVGRQTTLKAMYGNGQGSVTPGSAYLSSGYSQGVYVKQDTTFTLTVTNKDGAQATATASVGVTVPPVGFQSTGNMAVSRNQHTATLLADGRVLFMGGSGIYYSSSPEVYDPITAVFVKVGPSMPATAGQTATRLQDGRVLLAGGGSGVVTGGVELPQASTLTFNPVNGTFSGGSVLGAARHQHSATLLPNGQVLIAGGQGLLDSNLVPLSSAELYDPVANTFKSTGSMVNARSGHTATLLSDGKVLLAGDARYNSTTGAEIYDPATGIFTSTRASMAIARRDLTATLLNNGKVLFAGNGSADLYDPATDTFTPMGSFDELVGSHIATLLPDGTVLFAGGGRDGGAYGGGSSAYAWLYDPINGTFRDTGSMATPRQFHSATLLHNGKVLVAGGQYYTNSGELYGFAAP
ncbi:MAG: hypothetical protein IPP78_16055 [Holophagaceae bacterium]|nr:hypothetical protein [Holophagaceae bacterium]